MNLRELADHEGPFASVYVDSIGDTEDAARQQRLRRRAVRDELAGSGAPAPLLGIVDDTLATPPPGRSGQVVIADRSAALIAEPLPTPPPRRTVRLSPLPYLLPLLQLRQPRTPHVVVLVDRSGADVRGVDARGQSFTHTIRGATHPLHKVGGGGSAHGPIQHHVEDTVRRNIAATAEEVGRIADRAGAALLLVCGEVAARTDLCDALRPRGRRVVQVESGSRAAGSDPELLDREIRHILCEEAELRRRAVVDHFTQERERDRGLAVQGIDATTAALREANADTLLVDPDALGDRVVRTGADPTQVMPEDFASPGTHARRADEALPLAALAARASVVTTDRDHAPPDGVGALLRHA
ncbi:Vms1/Ankzf1 family peptidyl-tRNA hydrolase [Nocardia wallacei]|uniref:Rv2629 family ribosome hibernation factor n=1 Tax=Nocardia wallacei TaxID=480035 RepID=UPI00245487B8|nr:Vms1/Ankzf1 family peptidyl-tRNA hydrolase [Nocardia wallacei]